MKNVYFTVGPTQLYPTVAKHIRKALQDEIGSISHRGKKTQAIIEETTTQLRAFLRIPKTHSIFFLSSSLENMERIIQNSVEKRSAHLIIGEFSKKFYTTALELGKNAIKIERDPESARSLSDISFPRSAEVICLTQNETSTGVAIPEKEIAALRLRYPDTLIAVDAVSSIPYAALPYKYIDMAFFSVQKGFGLPAGLGVLILSPKALAKANSLKKKGRVIGSYHSFPSLVHAMEKYQTPETPNLLLIYVLGQVISDMETYGIKRIRQETEEKANMLYAFFETHKKFEPFVTHQPHRSQTTIVIDAKGKTAGILALLAKKGMIVGAGYGPYKDSHIRIANFPAHSRKAVEKLIRAFA